jgi:hypothetical protein
MAWTIVEEPSLYQPVEVWHEFLARLEQMDQADDGVRLSVDHARSVVALKSEAEAEAVQ